MQDFRKLDVWREAHASALAVYSATQTFPSSERFGLTSQMRRSAASVPTNIAEGCGRHTPTDFARFLDIAAGSVSEVDYQLLLARDLGYLAPEAHRKLSDQTQRIRRMLASLIRRVRNPHREPTTENR